MRRSLLAALLALVTAAPLAAQIVRPRVESRDPSWIGSLGVGFADPNAVDDGESRATWFFDSGFAFRASLERALRNQATIGVVATYGRFPLTYRRFEPILDDVDCGSPCEADADVVTAQALFHIGGGLGLHQVIELQAGLTNYRNFQTGDGRTLSPENETDFSFAAGYGIGFGFSRTLSLSLVQEFGAGFHGREGLSSGASGWTRTNALRAALRYGVGGIARL
jgi:opacity protein-like surface antigen